MTDKTTAALKLAENTLEDIIRVYKFETGTPVTALAAIREALAEPVKQEPVAWWNGKETAWFEHELCGWQAPDGCTIPLYAAPVSADHFLKAIAALREGIATCRAEALEEAAKVCDKYAADPDDDHNLSMLCAAAIRGLK
jgi:hypothetical protein